MVKDAVGNANLRKSAETEIRKKTAPEKAAANANLATQRFARETAPEKAAARINLAAEPMEAKQRFAQNNA